MGIIAKKRCFKCGKTKSIKLFYKDKRMRGGSFGKCKACCDIYRRKYYLENIKKIQGYQKLRMEDGKHVKRMNLLGKEWRERNPLKTKAHDAVNNAVKTGVLIREPCHVCKTTKRVEGHHNNYRKPLDVIWVCRKHHLELHGKNCWLEN